MRILITNDDGIGGAGLKVLARWAQKLGTVEVIAPKVEQSAKSHAVQIHHEFEAKQVDFLPGIEAWTVDSTPADCVRFALYGLNRRYDLVLSGINRGLNIGRDIIYSGTVSAASEAAYQGMQGIALSTHPEGFGDAEAHLDEVWALMQQHRMLDRNPLWNINFPADPQGIRITRQGGPYFSDVFHPMGNDLYHPRGGSIYVDHHDYSIDTDATLHGYISLTPLQLDRTNRELFGELSQLNP